MEARDYLDIIANEIHRTIVATVDDEGLPVTAAIGNCMTGMSCRCGGKKVTA